MGQHVNATLWLAMLVLGLTGCSEIFGSSDFRDVSVQAEAELAGDSIAVSVTIHNRSADTIFYHTQCGGGLERRDEGRWEQAFDYICVGWPPPPTAIAPEEEYAFDYTIEKDHPWFPPGDYRYVLALSRGGEDAEPLPDDVRTSNTFRIE